MSEQAQNSTSGNKDKEVCKQAMLCHFIAIVGFIVPFASVLAPLIYWQLKKGIDPFVDEQGKESVNFQINAVVITVALYIVFIILGRVPLLGLLILVAFLVVGIGAVAFAVYAAFKVNEGKDWRYPLPIVRLIK